MVAQPATPQCPLAQLAVAPGSEPGCSTFESWAGSLSSQVRWFMVLLPMPYSDPERQREYQRQWIARRRNEFFKGKVCVKCGSTTDLRLDHIDPTKKVSHSIWSWSRSRRESELAKCQVLCHPCHVKKTLGQMPITHGYGVAGHGTKRMYSNGCRCRPCTDAAVLAATTWRNSKKQRDIA